MAPSATLPCDDAGRELPHVAIFPFMARGHTIPLTHLAHLLLRRRLAVVTFFTTPGNAAFVRAVLPDGVDVVELPFPDRDGHASQGAENVEGVASASSFAAFAESTSALRPRFEEALAAIRPPATLLVADAFLYWTGEPATELGIPRVSFLGTLLAPHLAAPLSFLPISPSHAFAHVMREALVRDKPGCGPPQCVATGGATGTYTVPEFPHVQFMLADIPPLPMPAIVLDEKMAMAVAGSRGVIMNTFYDLESSYIDHWDRHVGPRAWPIGPLCLARQPSSTVVDEVHNAKPSWLRWLDEKAAAGQSVLFVALGTLLAVSDEQLKEVARGLEDAKVNFLWAVRSDDSADLGTGFHERVQGRGMVTGGWVDQPAILQHDCVRGFLSHCGWNSVLESICAGVPLAVWPMVFDQPLNAKLVVGELKVGVRVRSTGGLVKGEEVSRAVREIMLGETRATAVKNAAVLAGQAQHAMSAGGSSWKMVEEMITELSRQPTDNPSKAHVGGK